MSIDPTKGGDDARTRRKVLIASANPWSFCMAVERNVARRNADAEVDAIDMFALVGRFSPNWRRQDVLIERANRKFRRFVAPVLSGRDISNSVRLDHRAIPVPPTDVSRLREYRIGDARLGLGILSTVTSITSVQDPVSAAEYGPAFAKAWRSAHLSYQLGTAVRDMGYDEVHIFNGRHCYARPFCDLLDGTATVMRYEQGSTGDTYLEAPTSISRPETHAALIKAHPLHRELGETFYADRLKKAPGDPVNFYVARQVEGHLPEGLTGGDYVAFFSSSSDEMIAITDEAALGEFPTQYQAALTVAQAARAAGKRAVVRLHPHHMYKHASWRREWDFARLRDEGALVIAPEDACDTYALAGAAHCVFTCGSTVGFECSYRGIPNADVGNWVGGQLGAMHSVGNQAEVEAFIASPALPPGARDAALMYAAFWRSAGIPLPELDVGRHPYFATIDRRMVDPIRAGLQRVRQVRDRLAGRADTSAYSGRIVIDPHLEARVKQQAASL